MSLVRATPATGFAQALMRRDSDVAGPTGAANGDPSSLASTAAETSAALRTWGGAAGRSTRWAAWPRTALTTLPITLRTTARASALSSAVTGAGIVDANPPTTALSIKAGAQDTATSAARPPVRRLAPTVGTTRP